MNGPTHRLLGALTGVVYVRAVGGGIGASVAAAVIAGATSAGPTSPDTDQTEAWGKLRKAVKGVAGRSAAAVLNHRETTHWFGWPVLAWILVDRAAPPDLALTLHLLVLGWASHIAGDAWFGRVPLLPWPSRWEVGLRWDTGGLMETGVTKGTWFGRKRRVLPFGPVRVVLGLLLVAAMVVPPDVMGEGHATANLARELVPR